MSKIEIIKIDSKDVESGISHIQRVVKETKTRKINKIQDRKNYHTYPRKSDDKFEKRKIPSLCYWCRGMHWVKDCPYLAKECLVCKKIRHKSSYCRNKNQTKSRVRLTKTVDIQEESSRKYVTAKILGKDIKFQLDSGSDLTILNFNT